MYSAGQENPKWIQQKWTLGLRGIGEEELKIAQLGEVNRKRAYLDDRNKYY
jgi:hypothetical protein